MIMSLVSPGNSTATIHPKVIKKLPNIGWVPRARFEDIGFKS